MDDSQRPAEEPTSDVEGHARMRVTTDDVEGHARMRVTDQDDDVEGHARMRVTDQDDDVEGHLSFLPENYVGDHNERLIPGKGGAAKANVTDDVSGHDMRPGRTTE